MARSHQPLPRYKTAFGLLALLIVVGIASGVSAGPVFIAGGFQNGKFKAANSDEPLSYLIQYSTVSIAAEDGSVRTKLEETIVAPGKAAQTIVVIPLPVNVDEKGIRVHTGSAGELNEIKSAEFLNATEAQDLYEAIARETGKVAVVSLTGQPAVLVRDFELSGRIDFVVEFTQPVSVVQGVQSLDCPLPRIEWASGPVSRISLNASVKDDDPLRAVFSPTHDAAVDRNGLHEAVARLKAENWSGTEDFRLCWVADQDELGLRVLTYREEGEDEDGYFMVVGNPTGGQKPIDKDVIFVLDTSGSMRGEKIEQARSAIDFCLTQLNEGDRFNIVTFGTDVVSFRDAPIARNKAALDEARAFVEDIVAQGRTNISGALKSSLTGEPQDGRPRIAIFLTDGTPTAGELAPEKILEAVGQANTSSTRIFVMGVGHDVNAHLLDKLAESTDGSSEYVAPDEEIDAKVAALYNRLSYPVLTNVAVAFGDLNITKGTVHPEKLGALFKGSEIMIFGRYRDGGRHKITISRALNGKPKAYSQTADFPAKRSDAQNDFVAPLWAARNIGFLLQEIRLHGENDELLKEVVRLSKKRGIVTEYTEFLGFSGQPGGRFGGGFGGAIGATGQLAAGAPRSEFDEAKARVLMANQFETGRWAVQQALNDRDLQTRKVVNNEVNYYRDRRGKLVTNKNICQVGARTFYLNNGQWVDSADPDKRKSRKVELFSDEYFQLLRKHPEFAKAQKLGWAMSINLEDERIFVEKDGKQVNQELQKRSQQRQVNQQQAEPGAQLNINQFRNQLNAPNGRGQQQLPLQINQQQIRRKIQAGNEQPRDRN